MFLIISMEVMFNIMKYIGVIMLNNIIKLTELS